MVQPSTSADGWFHDEWQDHLTRRLGRAVVVSLLLHLGVLMVVTLVRLPQQSERPLASIEISLAHLPTPPTEEADLIGGSLTAASFISDATGTSGSLSWAFFGLSAGLKSPNFGASGGNSTPFMTSRRTSLDSLAGTGGAGMGAALGVGTGTGT